MTTDTRLDLRAVDLEFRRGSSGFHLQPLSLDIPAGSFTVILGQNGSGKTTLVRLFGGVLSPSGGRVDLGQKNLREVPQRQRARHIAFLAQEERSDVHFRVQDIVLMGRYTHQGLWPFDSRTDVEVSRRMMALCDTLHFADRYLDELSGGERRRVYLARALAQEPQILILDEPASSLDLAHQVDLYEFLHHLNRETGLTVIVVSHELNLATRYATQVVLLKQGRLVSAGKPSAVMNAVDLGQVFEVKIDQIPDSIGGPPFLIPRMCDAGHLAPKGAPPAGG